MLHRVPVPGDLLRNSHLPQLPATYGEKTAAQTNQKQTPCGLAFARLRYRKIYENIWGPAGPQVALLVLHPLPQVKDLNVNE